MQDREELGYKHRQPDSLTCALGHHAVQFVVRGPATLCFRAGVNSQGLVGPALGSNNLDSSPISTNYQLCDSRDAT
jgi:hypothetical protein